MSAVENLTDSLRGFTGFCQENAVILFFIILFLLLFWDTDYDHGVC